jgi:hypothetical protein
VLIAIPRIVAMRSTIAACGARRPLSSQPRRCRQQPPPLESGS